VEQSPARSALCGECETGFAEWSGTCVDCRERSSGATAGLLLAAFIMSWIFLGLIHRLCQASPGHMTIFFYFAQMSLFMVEPLDAKLSWLGPLNLSFHDAAGPLCLVEWNAYQQLAAGVILPLVMLFQLMITVTFHRCKPTSLLKTSLIRLLFVLSRCDD
jgi:hypothetical protein